MAIEISSLAQVTKESIRTKLMAWYNLTSCFSSAAGALSCGLILDLLTSSAYSFSYQTSCRYILVFYAAMKMLQTFLFSLLSSEIEVPVQSVKSTASPISSFLGLHKSKWIVLRLSLLFLLDSFGGSFVLQSIISSWFYMKFRTASATLGSIVFICNIVAGVSALFASKLADIIGLVMTMVVTHLPSNILIMLVPLMPTEHAAIAMLCLRYSISQMDVPTRNAYVQGVVDADERSAANGVTNVVRSLGASVGPLLSGMLLAQSQYTSFPFFIAGA